VTISWLKGHGTLNDFVLLPDPDGELFSGLDPLLVRRLCDRRRGIGADGVLRVVRTKAVPDLLDHVDDAEWFMDYRNADGSLAEMCGNGIRVYVRYLMEEGLVADAGSVPVGTRSGVRTVSMEPDGQLTVSMGKARVMVDKALAVNTASGALPAVGVHCPNPHAVVFLADLAEAGTLAEAPRVAPAELFPDGVNVEFVTRVAPQHVAMRVFERGVGETLSCGTGACAAALAAMRRDQAPPGTPYHVDVLGGQLVVTEDADGEVCLTGPAEITLHGSLDLK
jgi:diaminopimelate epimerase